MLPIRRTATPGLYVRGANNEFSLDDINWDVLERTTCISAGPA